MMLFLSQRSDSWTWNFGLNSQLQSVKLSGGGHAAHATLILPHVSCGFIFGRSCMIGPAAGDARSRTGALTAARQHCHTAHAWADAWREKILSGFLWH